MREHLIYTAILGRFNADLCEAVWDTALSAELNPPSGKEFVEKLLSAEIFCIPLDAQQG